MNCEEIKIHLIDLIDGNLSEPLRKEVEEGLANCPDCQQEYEELKMLFQTFQNQPIMPAPKALDDNFYALLEQEKLVASTPQVKAMQVVCDDTDNGKETNTPLLWGGAWGGAIKIAASLALLIVAFFIGRQSIVNQSNEEIAILKQEITETKNLVMLNMLKQESASERIKAVGYAYDMEDADKEMIDALVNVMNYDKSVNVRLEAINALYYFGDKKEVRQAMTQSLRLQTEPNLQIALIEMLVRLKEKGAVNEMQRMMKNKQLSEIVKFKAAEGVGELYKL
ncbi:MAG: HEAT repeat domain-containing protein [Thermoflexibacter sp.]|nr:HEAT repeat domain-containing protein [Thermoflexibacter sp.]